MDIAGVSNQEGDVILRFLQFIVLILISVAPVWAQATAFVPGGATAWDAEWQQIAGPKCLEMRGHGKAGRAHAHQKITEIG